MAWLEQWLFYLVEMELKSVLVKCEVYLFFSFWTKIANRQQVDQYFFLIFSQGGQEQVRVCQLVSTCSALEVLKLSKKQKQPGNVQKNLPRFLWG